jgi:DNA-binding beta-propeller fold protein YncE
MVLLVSPTGVWSQSIIATIPMGGTPTAAAVNRVTNKIYVEITPDLPTPLTSDGIVVIDGATQAATTLQNAPVGNGPNTIGVNETTNKIYVATFVGVLVIDGVTNAVKLVDPEAIDLLGLVVNPITNKIYVADAGIDGSTDPATNHGCSVTVIDGATDATTTITDPNVGKAPCWGIAVNTATNKIYVANFSGSNSVTVIDGTTNSTTTVPNSSTTSTVRSLAVDQVTNMIYVPNDNTVMAIDGATNATAIVSAPGSPIALAANTTTNKVYAPFYTDVGECSPAVKLGSYTSGCLGVMDGLTNALVGVSILEPPSPVANDVAVDKATNTIYVAGSLGAAAATTIIDGTTNSAKRVIDPNGSGGIFGSGIAINPANHTIYLLNQGSKNVTVIDSGGTPATHTLGVIGAPGSVTSSPAGLNCGGSAISSCPQAAPTFAVGSVVHLSAQLPGYELTWYGACTGTGACDVTMNSDQWLDAEFQPVPTTVPNVVGLMQAAATQALTQAGFILGTVKQQSSSTVLSGDVISESPAAGTNLLGGSAVDLSVSTGAPANPGGGGNYGGGGGGGGMDWLTLGALLGSIVAVRRRALAGLADKRTSAVLIRCASHPGSTTTEATNWCSGALQFDS